MKTHKNNKETTRKKPKRVPLMSRPWNAPVDASALTASMTRRLHGCAPLLSPSVAATAIMLA